MRFKIQTLFISLRKHTVYSFIEIYSGKHAHENTVSNNVHINIGNTQIINISVTIYFKHHIQRLNTL